MLRNANLFNILFICLESQRNFPISNFPRLWNDIVIPNTDPNDGIGKERRREGGRREGGRREGCIKAELQKRLENIKIFIYIFVKSN